MKLFPAVDILDGKAVRLIEGRRNAVTVYGDPIDMAHRWVDMGAKNLHIVDLNAAFGEFDKNIDILKKIARELKIVTQLGGGLREEKSIRNAFEVLGFDRAIIGSTIVTNPKLVERMANIYQNKIVAGLDAKDGKLAIKGWQEYSNTTPLQVAKHLKEWGVEDIVYTDISRDGMLVGPNFSATAELQKESKMNVIASGGVSSFEDLMSLKKDNIYGAIIGKALYENRLNLKEAIVACQRKE